MGTVWRVKDLHTGLPAALKVLHTFTPEHRSRFVREAELLGQLSHPGIVRHLAQGELEGEVPWLAMAWLEGHDLASRLHTRGLTVGESVGLAVRVAEALAAVHELGMVHRDLKPSNLFLPDGDPTRVVLIDFGIARGGGSARRPLATQTGMVLGTPGYMSPEQARGTREVDGRADLFSLGCLLHECLAGVPAFAGEQPMAILAKILVEPATPLATLRPELPAALCDLVTALLEKEPARRPSTAMDVAGRLRALGPIQVDAARAPLPLQKRSGTLLTSGEKRLFTVVLGGDPMGLAALHEKATIQLSEPNDIDHTAVSASRPSTLAPAAVQREVLQLGGEMAPVGEVSWVVTFQPSGATTDQAERAVRAAGLLARSMEGLPVAVATGRGVAGGHWPVGDVIDRAAALLTHARPRGLPRGAFRVDALTAGLLGPSHPTLSATDGAWVLGPPQLGASARRLLGRPSPCVGREREIRRLMEWVELAREEQTASFGLVVGGPGLGKSRLRDEFTARLVENDPSAALWVARGELGREGTPYHVVGQWLAMARGPGAPSEAAWQRWFEERGGGEHERRLALFALALERPESEEAQTRLAEMKAQAGVLAEWSRDAFRTVLALSAKGRSLVLVADDLHWADGPSVALVVDALSHGQTPPLSFIALGRPELRETFPRLVRLAGMEELTLRPLSTKASLELVSAVLGGRIDAEGAQRLAEQAEGNAFFLEELIRSVAEGRSGSLPETALALAQTRLDSLDGPTRRVLRGACLFGRQFPAEGVSSLLNEDVGPYIAQLVEKEWLDRRASADDALGHAYVFRHALLHDAVRSSVVDADEVLGHRHIALWLKRHGEEDPAVLAAHWEAARQPDEAARAWFEAGRVAHASQAWEIATLQLERAMAGLDGEAKGMAAWRLAECHHVLGRTHEARKPAAMALALAAPDSDEWLHAAEVAGTAAGEGNDVPLLRAIAEALLAWREGSAALEDWVYVAVRVSWPTFVAGLRQQSEALLDRVEASAARVDHADLRALAALEVCGATRTMIRGDLAGWARHEWRSAELFDRIGDRNSAIRARGNHGYALGCLGRLEEAESALAIAEGESEARGQVQNRASAQQNRGLVLCRLRRFRSGLELLAAARETFMAAGDIRMGFATSIYEGLSLLLRGEPAAAAEAIDRGTPEQRPPAALYAAGQAVRALACLALGRSDEAQLAEAHARGVLETEGELEDLEAVVRWASIECANALGDAEGTRVATTLAWQWLSTRAARLATDADRAVFLDRIEENRRIVEWARTAGLH